ncbi:HlyC/CorC family transporter [bacterium]|nr:MAG: HlyC/CorC family transporter [bacterium]
MSSLALALGLCLALVALFAASEAALAATNRVRLRHLLRAQSGEDGGNAQLLSSELDRDAQNFIASVTLAANLPLVGAASLALWVGIDQFGEKGGVVFSAVIAAATLAFFQIVPRLLVSAPGALERLWWVRPARLLLALLWPVVALLLGLGRILLRPLGAFDKPSSKTEAESDYDFLELVESAEQNGELSQSRELIASIFTFGDTRVHEVMIPRPDIIALPRTVDAATAIAIFQDSGYSRLPIYGASIDEVVGILHVKDVLRQIGERNFDFMPRSLMREPLYLPESQTIDDALTRMRAAKTHLALVMDEYGGTAGLLTIEDVLEELVGEIADEHDRREESLVVLDERTAIADAHLHADDLREEWDVVLPSGEFDTVGGYVIETLGREARLGDVVEAPGAVLSVYSLRGRRPRKIKIEKREIAREDTQEKES